MAVNEQSYPKVIPVEKVPLGWEAIFSAGKDLQLAQETWAKSQKKGDVLIIAQEGSNFTIWKQMREFWPWPATK
jgi:hypothetical protein